MSNEEVFKSRDRVNEIIVDNLTSYGNIEPPALYGRAYNEGTRTKYPFSAANYLRIAAAQRENNWQDIRWLSEQAIEDRKLTLKPGAKPVEIEYWRGIDNSQSYEGNLRKFYNAADIVDMAGTEQVVPGNEETDREYALDLLRVNGFDIDEKMNSYDKIFSAVQDYAKSKGADEFAALMTSQIFFKTSHLGYDYSVHPLYTEAQIRKIAENPKIIFHATKKAQELVSGMQQEQDKELKKLADKFKTEQNQPFNDLSVDFLWSERHLKDSQGKEYQEGQHLQGEAAYQFLVQLNAADKEQFNNKLQGFGNYDKTKIAIRYGDYDHGEMRIDLGDLELRNQSTIADAMLMRFNEYRNYLMTDAQAINAHIGFQKSDGKEVTREQVIAECEQENAQCERIMQRFAQEEKRYLEKHPELNEINEQKADTFLYYCTEQDFSKVPKGMVLAVHRATEFDGLVFDHCNFMQAVSPEVRKLNRPKPNDIVFESAVSNDSIEEKLPIKMAFTKENQIAMENLEKLSIKLEDYGTVIDSFESEVIEKFRGARAVQHFIYEKNQDIDAADSMNREQKIMRQHRKQLIFSYNGEEFCKLRYEIGSGVLNQRIPSGLPVIKDEQNDLNKELQQAVYTQMKYQGIYREDGIYDLNHKNEVKLPEPEVMRAKIMKNKPEVRENNGKQFAYYAELATLDFNKDTPVKVMETMVQEMKQDGLDDKKIANIIKTNKHFDLALLDEKSTEHMLKIKKRKLQVNSEKKDNRSCEMSR